MHNLQNVGLSRVHHKVHDFVSKSYTVAGEFRRNRKQFYEIYALRMKLCEDYNETGGLFKRQRNF